MFYLPFEEGQGLVEYALILALVSIVVIVGLAVFGDQVRGMFNQIAAAFS